MLKKILLVCVVAALLFTGCNGNTKEEIAESTYDDVQNDSLEGTWIGVESVEDNDSVLGDYGTLEIYDNNTFYISFDDVSFKGEILNKKGKAKLGMDFSSAYKFIGEDGSSSLVYYNSKGVELYLYLSEDDSSYIRYIKKATTAEKEDRGNADFRNVFWGDNVETVRKYEDEEFFDCTEDSLVYICSLNGVENYLIYSFEDDKLYRAGYLVRDNLSAGQCISFLDSCVNTITEKYGSPIDGSGKVEFTRDSLIEYAGEDRALEYGYIGYRYEWNLERTNILAGATSKNYEVSVAINYTDVNYQEEVGNEL